jgi:hypothetical protein
MSILPYLSWYAVAHSSIWIADADEILYAINVSNSYYRHPTYLSDPTFANGGRSIYSWLQLVPAELICKALKLQPIRFGLIVRIFGGLAVGFGWYAVLWQHVRRPWAAFLAAVFLMTDGGWIVMRPFVYQWGTLASVLFSRAGDVFGYNPSIHREWRIISPVVILPFLLFYLLALRGSVEKPSSHKRLVCSGVAFGLLFYAYFYYWTAAGLALLLGIATDRGRWRTYFYTGCVGFFVGTPELAKLLFAAHGQGVEWMQRTDHFLPIPRLSEHGHIFLSATLVVVTFVVVRRFFRPLLYLWCLCASGFIMIHQQIFTGFQMENYHWAYLFCPCMILLVVLLTIDGLERAGARGRLAGRILAIAVIFNAAAGLSLRALEAVRTKDSQRYSREYVDYENQEKDHQENDHQENDQRNQPLVPGALTGGTEDFVQLAMIVDHVTPLATDYPIIWSAAVSDLDFDRRIALNAYVSGTSRQQFETSQGWELDHMHYGAELRDAAKRGPRLASRLALFDQIASNPAAAFEDSQLRYVALPAGSPRPVTLGSDWVLIQPGPTWEVWERRRLDAASRLPQI